ncbi:uncharacterized protein LOC119276121 [Triticum dicoccoides]|uniref:uncharacterized protein LOC119276121 n=1 Tax=Triticum dicoccoides TaxID=85692 RepID=UPI00188F36E3|nr:uncharacterized protein LOC119276121 [Triticum dicoccoides]
MGFDLSISTSTRPALFIGSILVPDIHHMTILLCCIKNNCVRTIPAESIDDKTKLKGFSEFENTYYKRPKINGRCWCHTFEVLMETNKHLCRKAIEMCKSQSQQGMVILPAEKKSWIVDLTWQPCISLQGGFHLACWSMVCRLKRRERDYQREYGEKLEGSSLTRRGNRVVAVGADGGG